MEGVVDVDAGERDGVLGWVSAGVIDDQLF